MCLAVPMRVVALGPGLALVDRGGVQLPVLLHLLDEPVNVGDWLAVQAIARTSRSPSATC